MNKLKEFDISTCTLHLLAMLFMLFDHVWAVSLSGMEWLTCIGRIAFPIFAFMLVEGFFYTHCFKKYMQRLLILALLSEIPFDFMYGGSWFYPYHQNVIWTLMLGLFGIWLIDKAKKSGKMWLYILTAALTVILGFLIGYALMIDYYGIGVVTILAFYFLRGRKWWCFAGQFFVLYFLNVKLLGGYYYSVTIFGHEFELVQQGFALLSLIPIWLYRGRQGYHSKAFRYLCYAFYPVHIVILVILIYM